MINSKQAIGDAVSHSFPMCKLLKSEGNYVEFWQFNDEPALRLAESLPFIDHNEFFRFKKQVDRNGTLGRMLAGGRDLEDRKEKGGHMGRSNQPMGLCSDAVSFLEKEKVTPESCPYCNRPFSPKSFPSTIEEIGEYEGYFDEKFPLLR